jgi:hypothetical protein
MNARLRRAVALSLSISLPMLGLAVLLLGVATPARASNIVVNDCSATGLRAKVLAANDGDVITFNCTLGSPLIVLTHTQVLSHSITLDGGSAITLTGGGTSRILTITAGHTATLANLALTHGRAAQGSAINVLGSVVVDNVTFFDNVGSSANPITGGAISLHNARATVSNSRFISNSAQSAGDISWGGAIGGTGALSVSHTLFFANHADIAGAIFLNGSAGWIGDSTFITNSAIIGGAIVAYQDLTLIRDEFDLNHTAGILLVPLGTHLPPAAGGALSLDTGTHVSIQHSLFFSNTATTSVFGRGGAITNRGELTVADTLFNANNAQRDGGAIANFSELAVSLSSFGHNSALVDGGAISNTGSLNVSQSTFFSNTAQASGGALANQGQSLLQYSLFAENAAGSGGSARNNRSGVMDIESSTFVSNTALSDGGALVNNSLLTATNSTLVGNTASGDGGALTSGGLGTNKALLLNSSVVSNTALTGAALRRTTGSLTLVNTIVAGNSLANCAGTIVDGGHNLQFGDTSCGPGITNTNPLLGRLQDNGGPRLGVGLVALPTKLPLPGSPAINTADSAACPTRDERGFLRLAPCDSGAVERVFPVLIPLIEK